MSTAINILCTIFTLIALMIISTYALDNIHERCTITEGAGVSVDSCDGSKFISCQNGRCTCNDATNQIYTFRMEKEKRQRRGLGKKVAIGAGGAFVGYQVAKATSGGGGGGHSSGNRESSKNRVFACYGRVGAPCALNYNNVVVVKLANSTIEHSQNETEHENNSTSTTAAPTIFDLSKLAKCVDHAVCKPRDNSTILNTDDPRVGVCSCDEGFKKTKTDICESKAFTSVPSSFIMAIIVLSHHMFL